MTDYYKILEVSSDASEEVIRVAYKALAKKYHPDTCGDESITEERMKLINEAYETLVDTEKRAEYDKTFFEKEKQKAESQFTQEEKSENVASESASLNIKKPKRKFPIVKVGVVIFIMYLGVTWFSGGQDTYKVVGESSVMTETAILTEEENAGIVKAENNIGTNEAMQYIDAPVWSEEYLSYFLNNTHMNIVEFSKEEEKLNRYRKSLKPEQYYIEASSALLGNGTIYKQVFRESNLLYMGEMKNEKPNGYGEIYKILNAGSDTEPILFTQRVYTGMFKKGQYSGFGKEYVSFNDENEMIEFGYRNIIREAENPQKYVEQYFNELQYMGYFSKGVYEGKGLLFGYPEIYRMLMAKQGIKSIQQMGKFDHILAISSGDFKAGLENGNVTQYLNGDLLYEGSMKKGYYDGKGSIYYWGTPQIKYKGEFEADECNGKGTLYDIDGKEICSGIWKDNFCGVVNASDYISPLSTEYENMLLGASQENKSEPVVSGDINWENQIPDLESQEITASAGEEGNYILPISDKIYYTTDQLLGLTKEELRLARNEIYARHGRKFETDDLKQYFSGQSWYNGYLSAEEFDDSVLNEYEKANLDLIKEIEQGEANNGSIEQPSVDINNTYAEFKVSDGGEYITANGDKYYSMHDLNQMPTGTKAYVLGFINTKNDISLQNASFRYEYVVFTEDRASGTVLSNQNFEIQAYVLLCGSVDDFDDYTGKLIFDSTDSFILPGENLLGVQ